MVKADESFAEILPSIQFGYGAWAMLNAIVYVLAISDAPFA